jgi:hypothetical protein
VGAASFSSEIGLEDLPWPVHQLPMFLAMFRMQGWLKKQTSNLRETLSQTLDVHIYNPWIIEPLPKEG